MKRKMMLWILLLVLALSLTACGKSAPAEDVTQDDAPQIEESAQPEETVGGSETMASDIRPVGPGVEATQDDAPQIEESAQPEETVGGSETVSSDIQPTGPGVEATGTPAETSGELVFTMDYDMEILDGSVQNGWFVSSLMAKGYGARHYAVCPATGQVIEGEEGAPVVLCGQGLIRFVWKDAGGNEVSAYAVYFMMDEPQTYTLYAQIYGLDGQLREEREVMTWTQNEEDPYSTLVRPAIESIVEELGGGYVEGRKLVLNVTDEDGDAVIHSKDGSELIRLPGADASGVFAYASADGSYVSVYRSDSDQTEFYCF